MKNVMLIIMVFLSGCVGSYVEVGVGHNTTITSDEKWNNGGGSDFLGATLEIGQEWEHTHSLSSKCRWLHISQYDVGPPFNDRTESALDHFGCAIKYQIKQ